MIIDNVRTYAVNSSSLKESVPALSSFCGIIVSLRFQRREKTLQDLLPGFYRVLFLSFLSTAPRRSAYEKLLIARWNLPEETAARPYHPATISIPRGINPILSFSSYCSPPPIARKSFMSRNVATLHCWIYFILVWSKLISMEYDYHKWDLSKIFDFVYIIFFYISYMWEREKREKRERERSIASITCNLYISNPYAVLFSI